MICFIGPPCIGKGYQIDILKKEFVFDVFSVGEYLRSQISLNTNFDKRIKSTIDSGEIVSSNLIFSNMDLGIMQKKN